MDLDFKQLVPRLGDTREAFEELCCQLASREIPTGTSFVRLKGAGGDGGIECFADLPDRSCVGWQAKYVFEINSLLKQAEGSLNTALEVHPTLTQYYVCFPFDLTGPTKRKGQSSQEKFDIWRKEQEEKVAMKGRKLTIERWSAFELRQLLLKHDSSGGIREFFFNQRILTIEWFSEHLRMMKRKAGPRYTPELNVTTDLWKWFAGFGRTNNWSEEFRKRLYTCRQAYEKLISAIHRTNSDLTYPPWPEPLHENACSAADIMVAYIDKCDRLIATDDYNLYRECIDCFDELLKQLLFIENQLSSILEVEHGKGRADSPDFRQFMAEYEVSFPAANLDDTREIIGAMRAWYDWLCSHNCSLAYQKFFVLSGNGGSGKTHGVCDTADYRFQEGLLTCVIFGHEFSGVPDPWTRLLETLGLPTTLGMDGLLDTLNAAGQATGHPLILCIDAINETRPLKYWRERLASISQAVEQRSYLRLCVTCRTSFLSYCLPDNGLQIVEHTGFVGIEREACQSFFKYYELDPPIAPILQPELSNPLYLRLLCETLRHRGLRRLPVGWHGIATTIRAFLDEKERQFSQEYETSLGASIVKGSLMALARRIVELGISALPWTQAQQTIEAVRPQAKSLQVLEWLIRADLLIEDGAITSTSFDEESTVRPAFERLGDFLIASELMERCKQTDIYTICQQDALLYELLKNTDKVEENSGVLAALSVLIPEQNPGIELPDLVQDKSIRDSLIRITIHSFSSRDPNSFTESSKSLIREALIWRNFSFDAMDVILTLAWQKSVIDAIWLDSLLKEMPLAVRDAYWCSYLYDRFESQGTVYRLINAVYELPIDRLEQDIAELWSIVLLWFSAAADRRVKDCATRAVIVLFSTHSQIIPNVLQRLINLDDDEVKERAILSCYGALIISRNSDVLHSVATGLQEAYLHNPESYANALLRDHIRCIGEYSHMLNVEPNNYEPELTIKPIVSEWPVELPSKEQVELWGTSLRFLPSEFVSDFFKYSMSSLNAWEDEFSREDMAKWILQRVINDLGYENSDCKIYDSRILSDYGGGRAKPVWAERIGKKYLWIAMYQLASYLHDCVERKHDRWTPEPLQTPLILLEERKTDPTFLSVINEKDRDTNTWWIASSVDFTATSIISDKEWVQQQTDIPPIEQLLSVIEHGTQNWQLLVSYISWNSRNKDQSLFDDPYREIWMHLHSYLVPREDFNATYASLQQRNFFGRWMPEGATFLYGFAGEYPWATPFNMESDEWRSWGGHGENVPANCNPAWNELAVEWEYDASISRNFHMNIPSRSFFSLNDLWWNGKDGYRLIDGRTVFQDPSVATTGPSSLLVDKDDLLDRLDRLGLQLIWTLLGEKIVIGRGQDVPRRTFSQIACLTDSGLLQVGERVFFDS